MAHAQMFGDSGGNDSTLAVDTDENAILMQRCEELMEVAHLV
jgi:hypothetical protein